MYRKNKVETLRAKLLKLRRVEKEEINEKLRRHEELTRNRGNELFPETHTLATLERK